MMESVKESNCSVSPVGLTMPFAANRLKFPDPKDPEKIMMRLWEKVNTRNPSVNWGGVPLDSILHECNDRCGKEPKMPYSDPHSYTGELSERDIRVAAAAVQWLATPVGRTILEKFFKEMGYELHRKPANLRA